LTYKLQLDLRYKKVYTFNSAFKHSEWVKINSVWQRIPDIYYTLGKTIVANIQNTMMFK